jgi:hypothetical protein
VSRRAWIGSCGVVLAAACAVATATARPTVDVDHPLPAKRPPGWIAIEAVSNGCGPGKAQAEPGAINKLTDSSTFGNGNPFDPSFTVNFRAACLLHDAGYSGALVWDRINGKFVDFRGMTKKEVDDKFFDDMAKLCEAKIPARWETALKNCKEGIGRYLIVRAGFGYRDRVDLTGTWLNPAPGWPVCDVGAHPWRITQTGRKVTARWRHGNGTQTGEFDGIFVTGDQAGDDRVEGTFTINDTNGKVGGGSMTFVVKSEDGFDFNGGSVGGKMTRRSTQGVAARVLPPRCRKPATPRPPQAGTFVLTSTKVSNPNAPELTIDAAGGKAIWDHTGQYGGAGKGGEWRVDYTFKVPKTLTAGKRFAITLGLAVSNAVPVQPLLMQIGARSPDFVDSVSVNYPNPASASKTFSVPLSAGYKAYKDIAVIVGFVSAEVTFVYHRVGV